MTEKPVSFDELDDGDDTMIVAPPGFRERVAAAQKAKTSEIRQSVELPNPLLKKTGTLSAAGQESASVPVLPDTKS